MRTGIWGVISRGELYLGAVSYSGGGTNPAFGAFRLKRIDCVGTLGYVRGEASYEFDPLLWASGGFDFGFHGVCCLLPAIR